MTYGPLEPISAIKLIPPKLFFDGIEYQDCELNEDGSITLKRIIPAGEWSDKIEITLKDRETHLNKIKDK